MDAKQESLHGLRTAEIQLSADLGTREREWVLGRLMSQSGVEYATWADAHACNLVIEYDADRLTGAELVSILYLCGLPPPVR